MRLPLPEAISQIRQRACTAKDISSSAVHALCIFAFTLLIQSLRFLKSYLLRRQPLFQTGLFAGHLSLLRLDHLLYHIASD